MKAYIIEYRFLTDKDKGIWGSKISQEGYDALEKAQAFIESRANHPAKCSNYYYQTEFFEEYYIHEVLIR